MMDWIPRERSIAIVRSRGFVKDKLRRIARENGVAVLEQDTMQTLGARVIRALAEASRAGAA